MKNLGIFILIVILFISCKKEKNEIGNCNYQSTGRYIDAIINDSLTISSIDSIPNMINCWYTFLQFENQVRGYDHTLNFKFDSLHSKHTLEIHFVKDLSLDDFYTIGDKLIYKDFENYVVDGLQKPYLWSASKSEGIWIEYRRNYDYYFNKSNSIIQNDFSFIVDSTRFDVYTDCKGIVCQDLYISGKFHCKLLNADDYLDTITISSAKFKGYISQSYIN